MREFFLRGLSALLPTVLTLWILTAMFAFLRDFVARPITDGIHWCLITNQWGRALLEETTPIRIYEPPFLREDALPEPGPERVSFLRQLREGQGFFLDLGPVDREALEAALEEHIPPLFGLSIGLVLIFFLGFLTRGWFGAFVLRRGERLLFSFPLVRSIYPYAKQVVDFFFQGSRKGRDFDKVVAVPYPSRDLYTLGFVTSEGLPALDDAAGGDFVAVFVPSSPTPMTGYLVFVPRASVIPLSLSVDQAMGLVVSGGVITPDKNLPGLPARVRARWGAPRGSDDALAEPPSLVAPGRESGEDSRAEVARAPSSLGASDSPCQDG